MGKSIPKNVQLAGSKDDDLLSNYDVSYRCKVRIFTAELQVI